ncbi:hypothetical protein RS9916_26694 [Synechococcus sp. RS9916]|nr:hypothetical protein RS9916_26694 [Synechococcus sp. RS9916]
MASTASSWLMPTRLWDALVRQRMIGR